MELKKPEIKSWDCTDLPIEEWKPEDPYLVDFWCNLSIGIEGEDGADNFQVHVVSEKILPQLKNKEYMVVIQYYEGWDQILEILKDMISGINALNWFSMSEELSKMFYWEYEGFR